MGIGVILDLIILFALVGGVLWNMRRGFLRALIGLVMLFLAMTVAALLAQHGWEGSCSWMIGNSPRSDVNPALAAGLHAVYIPHPHTWTLEHEEPLEHPGLLELANFSDLRLHF